MSDTPFSFLARSKLQEIAGNLELAARYHGISKQIAEDRLKVIEPNNPLSYRLRAESIHAENEYWRCLKALNELETPGAPEVALAK